MERLLDIYNENNLPLGKVEFESVVYRHGLWHRTVLVVIHSPEGKILQIKTPASAEKDELSDKFAQICRLGLFGFVEKGEREVETACRILENLLKEAPDKTKLRPWLIKIIKQDRDWNKKREFRYIYFFQTEKDELPIEDSDFISVNQAKNLFQEHSDRLQNEDFWLDILNELSR